jgi:hypothetical protein
VEQTLRPLGVGELLDRTFTIYRRHFLLLAGISAIPGLLTLLVGLAAIAVGQESIGLTLLFTLITLVTNITATLLAQGASVVAVSQIQLGREATIAGSFRTIQPMLLTIIVTTIVIGILITIGFIFLIVPGVILGLMWALTVPVVVLEQRSGMDAASRSAELTSGHRGRIFLVYVVLVVLYIVASIVAGTPLLLLAGMASLASPAATQVITELWGYMASSFISPIITVGLTLLYYDQRVRKEAFDLEHMMARLDQAATPN